MFVNTGRPLRDDDLDGTPMRALAASASHLTSSRRQQGSGSNSPDVRQRQAMNEERRAKLREIEVSA